MRVRKFYGYTQEELTVLFNSLIMSLFESSEDGRQSALGAYIPN